MWNAHLGKRFVLYGDGLFRVARKRPKAGRIPYWTLFLSRFQYSRSPATGSQFESATAYVTVPSGLHRRPIRQSTGLTSLFNAHNQKRPRPCWTESDFLSRTAFKWRRKTDQSYNAILITSRTAEVSRRRPLVVRVFASYGHVRVRRDVMFDDTTRLACTWSRQPNWFGPYISERRAFTLR